MIRAIFLGVAALATIAVAPSSQRVLTAPVSAHISIGAPNIYLAVAVLDPRVAEINSGYLIIADRPMRGHIDGLAMGPAWSAAPTGTTSEFDLTTAQLRQVEDGMRELGIRETVLRGWIVSAPGIVFGQRRTGPVKIGEILVDLGPASQATAAIEPFTKNSSAAVHMLETLAKVHITFATGIYYKPDCKRIEQRTKAALSKRARASIASLEDALGIRLHLIEVGSFSSPYALCPDVHPVTISASNDDWSAASFSGFRDLYVSATARYAIRTLAAHHPVPRVPAPVIETAEALFGVRPYPELASERYVATTASLRAKVAPDTTLLSFSYPRIPQSELDSMLTTLKSIGVRPADVFVDFDVDRMSVWVRVKPATDDRVKQIKDVMNPHAREAPLLSFYMNDCSGRSAVITEAMKRSRERALRLARLLHANLGQPLSITLSEDDLDDTACGFSPSATTEQLAHAAVLTPTYFSDPIFARFPIRVDVAWSLSGKPATRIPADRIYSKEWPGPSCSAAEDAALQQDIEAANLDYGSIWSLLEQPPVMESRSHGPECANVRATVTIIHHP